VTTKLHVFVSSVQKELEDERLIVQNLINTDTFLSAHCVPVLYEFEPASPDKALEGCLKALDTCQIYLLIVAVQYGSLVGDLSITHAEYRRAKENKLPVLAFIKGDRNLKREANTNALLKELDADGPKYKRFGNVIELQKEVRTALVKHLKDRHGIVPSSDENEIAERTIEATSPFESQPLNRIRWTELDHSVVRRLVAAAENRNPDELGAPDLLTGASLRGLIWQDSSSGEHFATAAGIVLLAKDPSAVFPQCRILADAYRGVEADGDPRDHEDIRGPMPLAVDRALAFIDRNTRHPMKVVGLNRVRLDEYPTNIPPRRCVKRWSTRSPIGNTRTRAARSCSKSFPIAWSSPVPVFHPRRSPSRVFARENIAHAHAIRFLPNACPTSIASRSAAAASGECAIKCSTTDSISRSSAPTRDIFRSPSPAPATTSTASGCRRPASWRRRRTRRR